MPKLSFDHIHYRSRNFERTRHFYVDIMEAIEMKPDVLLDQKNLHFELAGVTLLFAQAPKKTLQAVPADTRLGVYHIAFLVENCDDATRYYHERGAKIAVAPFDASDTIRAAFLEAPDGMWVELKQIIN